MIWGFTLHPGEPCTKTVDKEVHLTMAALDSDSGVNDITKKKCCQVLMVTESSEFLLLCTLVEGLIYQQNVDLQLMPGERVTFCAQGGRVHLTGYSQVPQNVDVNKNRKSRTDASTGPESLTEEEAGCESDVIEELFSEQGFTTSSSESKAHRVSVPPKKDVPQKEVETKISNTNISPGGDRCNQPKKDVPQKKDETKNGKTKISVEKQSSIVIKEELMDLSIVESEPEVASSRVEATPKQTTGSIVSGDSQESAPTNKDKDSASHLTSRSNSPVECINQALSITYIPSELEDGMLSQSVKESEVSEIKVLENCSREVENRHVHYEQGVAPAQTSKDHNIATGTHTTGPGNQLRNSFSILRDNGQEVQGISQLNEKRDVPLPEAVARSDILKTAEHYQYVCPEIQLTGSDGPCRDDEKSHEGQTPWAQTKAHNISQGMQTTGAESQRTLPCVGISQDNLEIDQRNQGRDAVLDKPVARPNVTNATKCYQYEVRKIISAVIQEVHGQRVSMMSLLGEENKSSREKYQEEERATLSSAAAANSCSTRKRPHPGEEKQRKQNPLIPPENNIQVKKTRVTDKEKQGEAALVSSSSSTAGAGILNKKNQSQTSFENIKTGGSVIQSERSLPQAPVTSLPISTTPGTTKSNSGRRNKCDCCMKPSEERRKIMLGKDGHWFCLECYTTFSSDMSLLKYCRIVPQGKQK